MRLTPPNRRSEDVRILAVIIPELELRDVQRQIFAADFAIAQTMPRFMIDQKPSIVFVWTAPTTYSLAIWRTTPSGYSPPSAVRWPRRGSAGWSPSGAPRGSSSK